MDVAFGLLILLALYFLPFIIALLRSHPQTASIFVLDLFLGWTLIGWVVALAMSVSSQSQPNTVIVNAGSGHQSAPVHESAAAIASAPVTASPSTHEHQWIDVEAKQQGGGTIAQTRRCTVCGFIELKPPEPHDHTWGDPLPSQKFRDRLYQECSGCKEARYIN